MESSRRKGSPKERSSNTKENDTADAQPATRKPSTRVKGPINYDEKQAFIDLNKEIDYPVDHQDRALNELEEQVHDLADSWESESLFEDALNELTEDNFLDGKSICIFPIFITHRSSHQLKLVFFGGVTALRSFHVIPS